MRELTELELRAVSGGLAAPRPTQPPVIRLVVAILTAILRRLEGGDPRQKLTA